MRFGASTRAEVQKTTVGEHKKNHPAKSPLLAVRGYRSADLMTYRASRLARSSS